MSYASPTDCCFLLFSDFLKVVFSGQETAQKFPFSIGKNGHGRGRAAAAADGIAIYGLAIYGKGIYSNAIRRGRGAAAAAAIVSK